MANNETAHELILQILKTRMTFRQTIQRVLRTNNVDMTFEMLQVMHRLWKKPGVSQQYLAEQTAKDKACLTNLINNLEKKGWVERRGNPTDRRNKQIYLTEEGERLALRVKPLLHGIYGLIGDEMPSRQIVSCRNNLQKISGITSKNGRNDAKRLNIRVVTVSNDDKPKNRKTQRKADLRRRMVCKSLPVKE